MEIDFSNITPLDLRILNHLRKNSVTDEWEPLYEYLVNNFNTDPEDTQKIILIVLSSLLEIEHLLFTSK